MRSSGFGKCSNGHTSRCGWLSSSAREFGESLGSPAVPLAVSQEPSASLHLASYPRAWENGTNGVWEFYMMIDLQVLIVAIRHRVLVTTVSLFQSNTWAPHISPAEVASTTFTLSQYIRRC